MSIERKKYWQEGGQWFRETSWYHEDLQTTTTAVVREVDEAEVPAEYKPRPAAESPPAELPAPNSAPNSDPASAPRKPRKQKAEMP